MTSTFRSMLSNRQLTSLFVFLLFTHSTFSFDRDSDETRSSDEYNYTLFDSDEILKLTILSNFSSIMDDRGEDRSYHKGKLYYLLDEVDTIRRKVKLKTRGNFRRDPKNCKYPPIMVKFGKHNLTDSIFPTDKKIKLVTQCQVENYVLLEYLAYRIFNLLSDYSFRVRLAHITYADKETKEPYFTRYAFFIENEKAMAKRIHAEKYKPHVVQYFLDRESTITMAMFQYMIGNGDWFVTSKHNTTILQLEDSKELIAVPYDFDWSDLVNAFYTKPQGVSSAALKNGRVYKGLCQESVEYEAQIKYFNSKKDEIMKLVKDIKDLDKYNKTRAEIYLEKYYKILNKPESLNSIFQQEECIKEPVFNQKK